MIPALCSNFLFKFLDESPVYLFGKGDMAKTAEVLNKAAEANGAHVEAEPENPPSPTLKSASKLSIAKQAQAAAQPAKSWNYVSIIMHPKLRMRVLIFSILKFYLNMAFFGCIFALSSLGGSIHMNSFIAAFAEGLGYILACKIVEMIFSHIFHSEGLSVCYKDFIKRKLANCRGSWYFLPFGPYPQLR